MFPDISVIVTCYNYGKYLERCLRSIYNQIHNDSFSYEVLLVNDNSIDNTDSVMMKFIKFDNFHYISNPKNRGIASSCNTAIQQSNGRYIVRVDADDYVSRHFLFLLKFALDKNRTYQAFCCDYTEVDIYENSIRNVSSTDEQIACATMYRKEFMIDVGLYDESFEYREGHELNNRFRKKYKIGHIPIPLYYVRKHDSNRSSDLNKLSEYDKKIREANEETKL